MIRKLKTFVWDDQAKARLAAALHEAGHFVSAWHLGCAKVSQIWQAGTKFTGASRHGSTSAFNESVIGWAGPVAEIRSGKAVWQMFIHGQLSNADTDLINRHTDKHKSLNLAVKILRDNDEAMRTATMEIFRMGNLINFPEFKPFSDTRSVRKSIQYA